MGAIAILAAAGMLSIVAISPRLAIVHTVWLTLALALIVTSSRIDFRAIANYRWMVIGIYLGALLLLGATLLFAPVIHESRSWLALGAFRFQPSELMKVALIVLSSVFFARRHVSIGHARNLFVSFVYFLVPSLVILAQPDWGSALVTLSLWAGFLLVSGIRWRHLSIGVIAIAILGILSWQFFLEPYQKERVLGFLDPAYDPLGVNYSVIQAQIAIGSAGFFGKGFGQGTQTQLGFLPEPTNDFIFAAFVEEWGFFGGILVVAAFFFLIFRIVKVGLRTTDSFSQFVCLGTAILFLTEFVLNIGSNLALLPVVGVTFPFLSYGGSSLLTK
ncbi:MAG: FtsW/RodA/SpoVE family cell cycle protein, partial [Candidatus Woesebacteria bacterium]|nr:FtsW/RodA/SpoVE family cell cycle protein [Candidatus Woesebacteria bacterium]